MPKKEKKKEKGITCCNSKSFLSRSLTASCRSCISATVSSICKCEKV